MKKVGTPHKLDGWYEITPAEAARLLEARAKNRPLSESEARNIAAEIIAGNWAKNGETIVLGGPDLQLLDGQTRCRACVIANRTIVSYVVHLDTCAQAAFDTFDQGRSRSVADVLSLNGIPRYALAAAMLRNVILYEAPGEFSRARKVKGKESRLRHSRDAEAFNASTLACANLQKSFRGMVPLSVAAFLHYMAAKQDAGKASEFLNGLATGENLSKGNPILLFRNRLIFESNQTATRMTARDTIALGIIAWNAFVSGRKLGTLKWDSRTAFPRFAGPSEG